MSEEYLHQSPADPAEAYRFWSAVGRATSVTSVVAVFAILIASNFTPGTCGLLLEELAIAAAGASRAWAGYCDGRYIPASPEHARFLAAVPYFWMVVTLLVMYGIWQQG